MEQITKSDVIKEINTVESQRINAFVGKGELPDKERLNKEMSFLHDVLGFQTHGIVEMQDIPLGPCYVEIRVLGVLAGINSMYRRIVDMKRPKQRTFTCLQIGAKERRMHQLMSDWPKMDGEEDILLNISGALADGTGIDILLAHKNEEIRELVKVITEMKDTEVVEINNDNSDNPLEVIDVLGVMNMLPVKGGEFLMGDDEINREGSVHRVQLDDFHMSEFSVTQALWKKVMGNNPSHHVGDNLPVENVSWFDCQEFVKKLNEICPIPGKEFRLPTEAEWEYAARGGQRSEGYLYSGSDNFEEVAWGSSNSGGQSQPVGQKKPNELGIYDMSGNVWEWCNDIYDANYYDRSPIVNPQGPKEDEEDDVVVPFWIESGDDLRRYSN